MRGRGTGRPQTGPPRLVALAVAGALLPVSPQAVLPDHLPRGVIVDRVACAADPTQTYSLYLPAAYTPAKRWPLLYVFDPRGRGHVAAEIFREAAERHGWIVASSDNTRSDGPSEPNVRALRAMWPDLPSRVSVDTRRIYAAGFSGTVGVSWRLGRSTGHLAGLIGVGGHVPKEQVKAPAAPAVFGAAGWADFNYAVVREIDDALAGTQTAHRLEFFDGGHEWFPPTLADDALGWFEMLAMRDGRRPRDDGLIATLLAKDRAAAEEYERAGRLVEAQRRFDAIARTYQGLADVTFARDRANTLGKDPRVDRGAKEEARWREWEARAIPDHANRLVSLLEADTQVPVRKAAADIGVPRLKERAGRPGHEGWAAQRVLNWLFAQSSFYLWRDRLNEQDTRRAIYSQSLALEIYPDSPVSWYRLGRTQAAAGKRREALEALERATALGFRAVELLEQDAEFDALREDPRFRALVAGIRR